MLGLVSLDKNCPNQIGILCMKLVLPIASKILSGCAGIQKLGHSESSSNRVSVGCFGTVALPAVFPICSNWY